MMGVRIPPGLPFFLYLYSYMIMEIEKIKGIVKVTIEKIRQFLREVKTELKKVSWPQRKETVASTSIVLVIVIIIAIFLGLVDLGLSKIIRVILS